MKEECSALCERLQAFLEESLQDQPYQPENMIPNDQRWNKWSAERSAYHNKIEQRYRREFAPDVMAALEAMTRVGYYNLGDLSKYTSVRREGDLEEVTLNFCKWCRSLERG